jgi:enoyl-CoA hydratase/carnithine racemase
MGAMAVTLTRERGVGIITLDRPPANSYDIEMARELGARIDDARIDEEIGAVVLRSASEKFFSAGADVGAFQKGTPRSRWMTVLLMHEVLRKMEATPLIFIAEIAGHALGGGLEIALACDFRFAANGGYQMGLPEVNLGLFPANGGTQRLPRLVGKARGLELIVKARTFSPEGAEKLGIVDRLFDDPADLRSKTLDYAAELAAGPREAIGRAKITTQLGYDAPLDLGNALEREAIGRVFVSDDAAEGIASFFEKRKPDFKGS